MIVYGLFRVFFGDDPGTVPLDDPGWERRSRPGGTLSLFLILKGFSSGAVALTGVEAISNGVPAFRRPESKNAANTLVIMAVILGTLFFGVSVLAHHLHPYPSEEQTVIAQMGLLVFGNGSDLLRAPGRHGADPHPGGQHRVRRLPPAVVDHRQGRLPAPPAREPG